MAEPDRPSRASSDYHERASRRLPGGVNSNIRLAGVTRWFARGEGAWLWDVDGNDYVDYLLGQGPQFLGHAPPAVTEAVAVACRDGMTFAAQHPRELDAAERLCGLLGWPDMVRFGITGTEMVQAALRLARAATGRRRFVRFEGHYHGWLDNVLVPLDGASSRPPSAGQLPEVLDPAVCLPWNDADAVDEAFVRHGDDIAAVIMEPMMCNAGAIPPQPGYLERVRAACDAAGAVLVFDEVITGFRLAAGGAVERFGVTPDLATYGKAMAGGWPVAALAGRGDLMERFGTGEVTHAGTFNGSVMAMAAVAATLARLADDPPYEQVHTHGTTLMEGVRKLAAVHDLPLQVQGLPVAFHCSFGEPGEVSDVRGLRERDQQRYGRFAARLVDRGVWVAPRGIWYVSAAHGEQEASVALERIDAAMAEEARG